MQNFSLKIKLRNRRKRIAKNVFVLFLLISWLLTGWPRIDIINFPPKIREAKAAVAFDAYTSATAGTGNLSWTHTPSGTPRGVIVLCFGTALNTDEFTSVTYGGTAMSNTATRVLTGGEGGDVDVFFLGSSVPTGNQTVSVTVSGAGTKQCGAVSLTASGDTEVVDSDNTVDSTSLLDPSVTLSLNARTSFAALVFFAGGANVNAYTPLTGWTSRLENDLGSDGAGIYTYNTIGSSDVTAGWSQSADDAAMVALAVSEKTVYVGNGASEPSSVTIGPGGTITDLDNFTLYTANGSATLTALTVTLGPASAYNNISQVDITNTSDVAQCTAVTNPTSNTVNFTCSSFPSITTSSTTYKVRITPKTHANMDSPPGASYGTTGTVTAITVTTGFVASYGDSGSATITVDNGSPNGATSVSGTAGDTKVTLNWTSSDSSDFDTTNGSVILRWTSGSAGSEVPAEGNSSYAAGDTITTATVACVISSAVSTALSKINGTGGDTGCLTTALTNGQQYTYKVFQRDTRGNYDVGVLIGTFTPVALQPSFTQNDFRFYQDQGTVSLTTLWGSLITGDNEDITVIPVANNPPAPGEQIRLQINITVATANLPITTQAFKLQYKAGTDQDCSTGSWTDIGAKGGTTTAWRLFDNTGLGNTETEANQISTSDVTGGYSELVTSGTNPVAVNIGQDMEWDWPIESYSGQVTDATTYSFRMIESDDSVISYSPAGDCPTIETEPGTADIMRHGEVFIGGSEKGFFWAN